MFKFKQFLFDENGKVTALGLNNEVSRIYWMDKVL